MELKLSFQGKQVVISNAKFENRFIGCDTITVDGKIIYQINRYNNINNNFLFLTTLDCFINYYYFILIGESKNGQN